MTEEMRIPTPTQTCRDCPMFQNAPWTGKESYGICRIAPPQPSHANAEPTDVDGGDEANWPIVDGDTDFCGSHPQWAAYMSLAHSIQTGTYRAHWEDLKAKVQAQRDGDSGPTIHRP